MKTNKRNVKALFASSVSVINENSADSITVIVLIPIKSGFVRYFRLFLNGR
jgi:hypothetical protein